MGKLKGFANKDDACATILFKKSQHTLYTQSRTCSGLSQNFTRSGLLQLKKSVSQSKNYSVGGKVKRDLSIETDICILRRYVKKKKNKLSLQGSKTKYSTSYNLVDTEIDTITEFQPDTSACGDSEREATNNIQYDIAKLMVDNFKSLINSWVEKYLLENRNSNEKASVLYSMLHANKTENNYTSTSGSTFIIDRKCMRLGVKNKRVDTKCVFCEHCRNENLRGGSRRITFEPSCNSISIPVPKKAAKVISTLSIPKKKRSHSKGRVKRSRDNKSYTVAKNHSFLLDFSSFDLLTISTKSFTKRCATYNCDGKKKNKKKKIKTINTDTTTRVNNETKTANGQDRTFEQLPSLMKSIYTDPTNMSIDENFNDITNDHCTMTEVYSPTRGAVSDEMESVDLNNIESACEMHTVSKPKCMLVEGEVSEPLIKIDIRNESYELSNIFPKPEVKTNYEYKETVCNATNTDNKKSSEKKISTKRRKLKFNNMTTQSKRFRVKRDKKKERRGQQFLDHFQNVFQYFADAETHHKMKLDIHVTMMPVPAGTFHHQSTEMSVHSFDETDITKSDIVSNVENTYLDKDHCSETKDISQQERNIIPLLDGADNQAKYIFKSGSSSNKTIKDNTAPENTNNTLSEFCNIIFAETNIKNDISELKCIIKELAKTADILTKERNKSGRLSKNHSNISKAIQLSKETVIVECQGRSRSHDTHDPNEFYNRLMRKSTSYNIIDSESILRVTDMTSAANKQPTSSKSLPISNCEVQKTKDIKKQSVLTYFYDGYDKKFAYDASSCCRHDIDSLNAETDNECGECNHYLPDFNKPTCEIGKCCSNPIRTCRKTGMSFLEGLFYCVIMWIPVLIIAGLFYAYVIKDLITNSSTTTTAPILSKVLRRNAFKMSDLGF